MRCRAPIQSLLVLVEDLSRRAAAAGNNKRCAERGGERRSVRGSARGSARRASAATARERARERSSEDAPTSPTASAPALPPSSGSPAQRAAAPGPPRLANYQLRRPPCLRRSPTDRPPTARRCRVPRCRPPPCRTPPRRAAPTPAPAANREPGMRDEDAFATGWIGGLFFLRSSSCTARPGDGCAHRTRSSPRCRG